MARAGSGRTPMSGLKRGLVAGCVCVPSREEILISSSIKRRRKAEEGTGKRCALFLWVFFFLLCDCGREFTRGNAYTPNPTPSGERNCVCVCVYLILLGVLGKLSRSPIPTDKQAGGLALQHQFDVFGWIVFLFDRFLGLLKLIPNHHEQCKKN